MSHVRMVESEQLLEAAAVQTDDTEPPLLDGMAFKTGVTQLWIPGAELSAERKAEQPEMFRGMLDD